MPKWKKGATEFTVSVNHHDTRGYQSSIPKPIIETLGEPSTITFVIKGSKVEITGEARQGAETTTKERTGLDRGMNKRGKSYP